MDVTIADDEDCREEVAERTGYVAVAGGSVTGLQPGDAIVVSGSRRTAVTVAGIGGGASTPTLYLPETERRNAGVAVGDTVALKRIELPVAERVVLTMVDDVDVRGADGAVRRVIEGHPITPDDEIEVSVFGGSITVSFRATAVEPDGPARVDEGTEVVVRERAPEDEGPAVGWDDVAGVDAERDRLRALVAEPLAAGRTPEGVLLHGQAGTGKTLLASALGEEADATFVRVTPASRFYDGGLAVDALVDAATASPPSIVLFDDVDVLAPAGTSGGATKERNAARLAAVLDRFGSRGDVGVVGATTDPAAVEPGLRRAGRFTHEIELSVPDREGRAAILDRHATFAPGVDLRAVAERTRGYVGADLVAVATAAARRAGWRPAGPEEIEAALEEISPSGLRTVRIEQPDVTYADIGGLEEVKRDLVRTVEWPLRYPELFERVRSDAASGMLLYGPPGTGKTMLARAVANSSDANFIAVDGPELFDRYVGESERGVRRVFEMARRNAPTVVFFDEVDALASRRAADSDGGATDRVVSQLLTEIDGVEPTDDVVVIGATNRPDLIDEALLRPGRLEKVREVGMPGRDAREAIFSVHLEDKPVGEVDVAALADATDGYTGSDVAAVVREASMLAMEGYLRDNSFEVDPATVDGLVIEQRHLEEALATVTPSVSERTLATYRDATEAW